METSNKVRRWTFSVTDFGGSESYVDAEGKQIDYSDAVIFVGTNEEASTEGERRADAWEERANACAAKITHHSMGVV